MKVKLIEKEIGCHEKNLDCVLDYEKETTLERLLGFLKTKAFGRSRVRLDVGETKDGEGIYLQFWRPLKTGWRILAHFELKPISEEVCHEQDRARKGTEEEVRKEAAEAGVGENGGRRDDG